MNILFAKSMFPHDLTYKKYQCVLEVYNNEIIIFLMYLKLGYIPLLEFNIHTRSFGTLLDPSSFTS